jgi:hypothetical protein
MADEYHVTVTTRCIWQHDADDVPHTTLTLDEETTVENFIDMLKHKGGRCSWVPSELFLLGRFNADRNDGRASRDEALQRNLSLAACNVQDGDHFDDHANPELSACLSAIAHEMEFAYERFKGEDNGRRCARCGKAPAIQRDKPGLASWWYCKDPHCDFPMLKDPHRQSLNNPGIEARELRVWVSNKQNKLSPSETMPSLTHARLRSVAEADALYDAAKPHLQRFWLKRNANNGFRQTDWGPAVLNLLRKYLCEMVSYRDDADPIASLIKKHRPCALFRSNAGTASNRWLSQCSLLASREQSMPYAASLRLPEELEKVEPAHGRDKEKVVEKAMKLQLQSARATSGALCASVLSARAPSQLAPCAPHPPSQASPTSSRATGSASDSTPTGASVCCRPMPPTAATRRKSSSSWARNS